MIYKFKSPAAGDVIMLGPQGDLVMALLGREPAAKGIFEVSDMPGILALLQAAVDGDTGGTGNNDASDKSGSDDATAQPAVGLRQRLWPLIDMLRRCHAAGEPIVWGV